MASSSTTEHQRKQRAPMKYKKHSETSKQKVLDAFQHGRDWTAVAIACDMPLKTAERIISSGCTKNKPRGGARKSKFTAAMKSHLIECLEKNRTLTLKEMSAVILRDFNVSLSPQCISYNLHGMCFSLKSIREEPTAMNSHQNKEKRKSFAESLQAAKSKDNFIIYVDETNFNIHTSRSKGWSKKGQRAVIRIHSTKAPNVNVLCAVSSYTQGCINFKCMRGSVTSPVFADFLNQTSEVALALISQERNPPLVAIVIDNAPCHRGIEDLIHSDYAGRVQILRLGPYSPQLNPIEGCFSAFKSEVKRLLSEQRAEFDCRGNDTSLTERRFRILEETATKAKDVITLRLVYNHERHCEAAVISALNFEDMLMG